MAVKYTPLSIARAVSKGRPSTRIVAVEGGAGTAALTVTCPLTSDPSPGRSRTSSGWICSIWIVLFADSPLFIDTVESVAVAYTSIEAQLSSSLPGMVT